MTDLTVINDIHAGVIRTGGVTGASAFALRRFVLDNFKALLERTDTDLLINGDLFDTNMVPYMDLLEVYSLLTDWLYNGHRLILASGNHDLDKNTTRLSSFQFLCRLLKDIDNVVIVENEPVLVGKDHYVIPHMVNQETFDLALSRVPAVRNLYLHCNYNNAFAQVKDHSLNLTQAQAEALPVEKIILGHEHQRSTHLGGKVLVVGNQIPTSVADCLGNDAKYMLRVSKAGWGWVEVWQARGSFAQVDWRELESVSAQAEFIRVEGTATAAEASQTVEAISRFRQKHDAFVITNAINYLSADGVQEALSLEKIQSFDVMTALLKRLSPAQATKIKNLMGAHNVSES